MACNIKVDTEKYKALSALYKYCGHDCSKFYNYLVSVVENINAEGELQFSREFLKEEGNEDLNLTTSNPRTVKSRIMKFVADHYPAVSDGVRKTKGYDRITIFGYDSVGTRELGKRLFANKMLEEYHNIKNTKKSIAKEELALQCTKKAMSKLTATLAKRLSAITGLDAKEILKNLKQQNNKKYITDLLQGHEDDITSPLQNLIALYSEFSSRDLYSSLGIERTEGSPEVDPFKEFINEVLRDSRLNEVRIDNVPEDEQNEQEAQDNEQEESDGNTEDQTKDAEYDTLIRSLNNTMGLSTNFMTHLGAPIRALLGSLPKMVTVQNGNEKFVLDTDNAFGIADVMDANQCATVLYHYGMFENIQEMMDSILRISEQLPGFAAFKKLHEILEANPNLQLQFHRTFGKMVIGKLETVVENGVSTSRISNRESVDRESILTFKFINALKGSSLDNIAELQYQGTAVLSSKINSYNSRKDTTGDQLRLIADELAERLKRYYPSIDNLEVRNFILLNQNSRHKVDTRGNMMQLFTILDNTIKAANQTKENFKEKQVKLGIIRSRNWQAKKDGKLDRIIDTDPIYAEGYITKDAEAVATQLAKLLLPYTLISAPLNSRNAKGNQSSDVINSSLITQINSILKSRLNTATIDSNGNLIWDKNSPIVKLGNHKSKTKQYNFSSIILEHVDEDGKVINYGLFRHVDGKFVPTEYASELLTISLFNGASNFDDGTNSLYSEMSKGDYLGTAWRNFFEATKSISGIATDVGGTAEYFMRIPSDAPKTFCVTAPKYSAKGLMSIDNRKEIDTQITEFFNRVSGMVADTNKAKANERPINVTKHGKYLNLSDFLAHLRTDDENRVDIKIPLNRQDALKINNNRDIKIAFRYSPIGNGSRTENVYVMEGHYENGVLKNAKFVGFKEGSVDADIWQDLRNKIWSDKAKLSAKAGGLNWNIDTKHRIFRQFKNIFRQELTDMVTAASVMFERTKDKNTGNYIIKTDGKGRPVLKKNSKVVKSNTEHNGLHPIYHFADKEDEGRGPIYVEKDGKVVLTGKVFTSDRFVIYNFDDEASNEDDKVRNYGQDILDRAFDLLATRTSEPEYLLQFDKNGNIIITPEQEAVIDEILKEFILDYVDSSRERLSEISDFIETEESNALTTTNIADFVLNYHLTYIGFNDLFEGDTKFYKDAQTFLKRAKEVQGSGVPYGGVDITQEIQPGHNQVKSPLDTTIVKSVFDENGNIASADKTKPISMYSTFRGLTIYNSIKTNKVMLDSMFKKLTDKDIMGEHVLTEHDANVLLYGSDGKGGYQDTTVNDAQSYITFDEWVRRITLRGQLDEYKPLIDKILDESQPLTTEDIQKFVQVQKNFYYDLYYNEDTKTISPRQIKNAEFVLIPRLIAGTELEQVAKLMAKLGVDQLNTVETSKAGQSKRFTIWNKDGHISDEILQDINKPGEEYVSDIMINGKDSIEYYDYRNLYTQQEAAQHIDAENKAGIQLMKKIVDNIDENSPEILRKAKEQFFELYAANIAHSFRSLMDRFGVQLDENGNIKLNEDGTIQAKQVDAQGNVIQKGIDYKVFYEALQDELVRLGLDSNMVDYCTWSPFAIMPYDTVMPNFMSLVAGKFENIVQSLFNHNITRQTLPGFHAAQVTGMGFRKLSEQYDRRMTSNILQYHPNLYKNGNGDTITETEYNKLSNEDKKAYTYQGPSDYIEIMVPAKNFGFDRSKYADMTKEDQDKEFLKQLKEINADVILGYRIPTEGKQSICAMKIVGFVDDAYGSTIVVPDDWVSQTGSDFDFDSVYGVQYDTYIDSKNHIRKVDYKDSFDVYDWMNYVSRHTKVKHSGITDVTFEDIKAEAKAETKSEIKAEKRSKREEARQILDATEQEAWENLDSDTKKVIRMLHAEFKKQYGAAKDVKTFSTQIELEVELLQKRLETFKDDYSQEELDAIQEFIAIRQDVLNDMSNGGVKVEFDYNSIKSEKIKQKIEAFKQARIDLYEEDAKENGLMSQEEYIAKANSDVVNTNSKAARNNRMLDLMKLMLTHNASLEENLSRSNFDDIKASLKKYNAANAKVSAQRKARSPYNILDQAEFQEDAMSGAKLKAFSVTRDTFCSVCNTLRPTLENNSHVKIFYSEETHSEEELRKSFDLVQKVKGGFIVTHNTFGWSKNNKNVEGKLLTPYSSQTTAHILDAIKTGNIPNVNDLTFQVYKTFFDIGSNTDTAISFMMQPGVRRIVDAYNKTNSIYSSERGKMYVLEAVRSILTDLGIEYTNYDKLETLIYKVNFKYGAHLGKILGEDKEFSIKDEDNANFILSERKQAERLTESGIFNDSNPVKEGDINANECRLLYDLQTILTYNKIDKLAEDIRGVARLSNPDKFGAKQSIFATRKILRDIVYNLQNDETDEGPTFRLRVDGKHVLSALYPGLEEAQDEEEALNIIISSSDFVTKSKYKPLAAFLKYATATSIKINKTLFITQSDDFVDYVMSLEYSLGNDKRISESTAKEFQNYIINHVILRTDFIQAPLRYNMGTGKARGFDYVGLGTRENNDAEMSRVFGYGHSPSISYKVQHTDSEGNVTEIEEPFVVNKINNPTQQEVDNFAKLSPAQKVKWIKTHFREPGIFAYIEESLFNDARTGKRLGSQTLKFSEEAADIETVRREFEEAYTNKNPFVALAAADIIKYAFVVEGYRMGIGNVSKMIPNSVLLNSGKIHGTNIVPQAKNELANISGIIKQDGNTLRTNFIRSHSNNIGLNTHNVIRKSKSAFELARRSYSLIRLDLANKEEANLAEKYSITYTDKKNKRKTNDFVKLKFGKETILYKIETRYDTEVWLIPMNILESNENSKWSANNNNNKYPEHSFYTMVIDDYYSRTQYDAENEFNSDVMNEIVKNYASTIDKYKAPKQAVKEHISEIPDFNTNPRWTDLRNEITSWYNNLTNNGSPIMYVWNNPLSRYVKDFGVANGLAQKVTLTDGTTANVRIYKVNYKSLIKKYTGTHYYDDIKPVDAPFTDYILELRKVADYEENHLIPPFFGDIYAIEQTELDANTELEYNMSMSTMEDVAVQTVQGIKRRALEDREAYKLENYYRDMGVVADKKSIKPTMEDVIVSASKYIEKLAIDTESSLRNFIKNPDGDGYLSIDNPTAINLIKNDPIKRRDYFKKLMEPMRIVEHFGLIKDLDIDSEDENMKPYLEKIKTAIEKMRNLPMIENAYENFAKEYYDKATDNPLVKQGLVSVLDGFYRTNWLNAMFNDIQETSNPIIQIAMKNFQQDLRAKQFQARKQAEEFAKHMEELRKKAREKGESFNLDNIIDEYGRFKLKYNDKFIEDRNKLQQAVRDAEEGSLEYYEAKLAYDEWKAKHVEQPATKDYYDKKNEALRTILSYPETTRKLFEKHEKLRRERAKLRNKYINDVDNPELDKEMDKLDYEIWSLENSLGEDVDSEPVMKAKKRIKEYVTTNRELEKEYFKYDAKYGFEDLVETNLSIIDKYENSGKPASTYINDPEYLKAKSWIRRNVIIDPVYSDDVLENSEIQTKISEARELFSYDRKGLEWKVKHDDAYKNELGLFDPRLVPDDIRARLREEQFRHYRLKVEQPFSDKTILSNSPKDEDDVVYKASFYVGMTGGSPSKSDNPLWQKTVTRINDLLGKYCYNEFTGEVDLERIPNTEEGLAVLRELRALYDQLEDVRGPKKSKAAKKFIKENVDRNAYNEEKYNSDVLWAQGLPKGSYRAAMFDVIRNFNEEGELVPNPYLYSYLKPKAEKVEEFIDKEKTEQRRILSKYTTRKLKSEYAQARYEARHGHTEAEYQAWIDANHVYNPFTHAYEPLNIWYETVPNAVSKQYFPKFNQTDRVVRDGHYTHKEASDYLEQYEEFDSVAELRDTYFEEHDHRNENYKENAGHGANYIVGSNPEYDNNITASATELEALEYMQNTLMALANTSDAKKYLENGWLPARRKNELRDAKGWLKELLKVVGWTNETYDVDAGWYDTVEYSKDRPAKMPMLEKMKGKVGDIRSKEIKRARKQKKGETDEDYAKYLEEIRVANEEIIKNNNEIHKDLIDRDFISVIQDFIIKAGTYNAVQDNKYELFYAQQLIKKYGSYLPTYNKFGSLNFKKDYASSNESEKEYLRKVDENLVDQFDNQLRRILYDQFKAPNNKKLLKAMSTLQGITSAQYMMLNVKGGIANVTLGESQIIGEAFAREFFDLKHWGSSKMYYGASVHDYIRHAGDEYANTTAGAIIKFMDVVDYDEHTGVSRLSKDAAEVMRRVRDFGYTPQTAGEHGMQNSAMFAMMMSHRLFLNDRREEFGQPKYKYMNYAEFVRRNHEKALLSILTDKETDKYNELKEKLKADANEAKEYAWYQRDVTTDFARDFLDRDRQRKFIEARDALNKKAKEEFNDDAKHPTILSQLELGKDGKMAFKADSMLAEMDNPKDNGEPSDAYMLLAGFKGRVIAVNKYIHGVYDKSGRAQFEKTFIGSLAMQYHKHLPLGIMKRYRWRGMYSEERGAVTKGMYKSLIDFISIPVKAHKAKLLLSDEEEATLEGAQNIMKDVIDFALHLGLAYNMLPDYDRANIRRMMGSICGVLAAMALTIAVRLGADDDDEDSLAYNLMLYEADRLATEAAQYFPPTFYTEGKKLWQSPIAAGSGITDLLSSANMIAHMIMEGDDFDGEYKSGKFAGESKLRVYIERRIPIWRGIKTSFIDINTNNSYYKVGENFLGFFNIKQRVEEWKK